MELYNDRNFERACLAAESDEQYRHNRIHRYIEIKTVINVLSCCCLSMDMMSF